MNWKKISEASPPRGHIVLTFSSYYEEGHPMRYRLISGDLIQYCSEVTHWSLINGPISNDSE